MNKISLEERIKTDYQNYLLKNSLFFVSDCYEALCYETRYFQNRKEKEKQAMDIYHDIQSEYREIEYCKAINIALLKMKDKEEREEGSNMLYQLLIAPFSLLAKNER